MLRLRDGQVGLLDAMLPAEARTLSMELGAVDALLDDDRFLAPFSCRMASRVGRPTIPIETYLRLMYLKHHYSLGYETLVKEVADSLSWRRFCRLDLSDEVPHSTTLLKLTNRLGAELVEELNRQALRAAVERKLLRGRRLRVDCTVMEADVRYPTDSGLCGHAISRLSQAVKAVKAAGMASRTRFRNRSRSAGKAARRMSFGFGRPSRQETVLKGTGELRDLARTTLGLAGRVLANARRKVRKATGKRAGSSEASGSGDRASRAGGDADDATPGWGEEHRRPGHFAV
jgi:transposase, IS5 family